MSAFELKDSLTRAAERLAQPQRRQDRRRSRLSPAVEDRIAALLLTQDRPSFSDVHAELEMVCKGRGLDVPSRATLYNALARVRLPSVALADLPESVRTSLNNLGEPSHVSAEQVVFYAFNYGAPEALSFAAGRPWLWLLRASTLTGWRPKSLGLLKAVMAYRGI